MNKKNNPALKKELEKLKVDLAKHVLKLNGHKTSLILCVLGFLLYTERLGCLAVKKNLNKTDFYEIISIVNQQHTDEAMGFVGLFDKLQSALVTEVMNFTEVLNASELWTMV